MARVRPSRKPDSKEKKPGPLAPLFAPFEFISRAWAPVGEKLQWLDPFTYVDRWVMPRLNPEKSSWKETAIYGVSALVFALLVYSILGWVLGTPTPLVIVVSGSMEPVLHRGDVVLLTHADISQMNVPLVQTKRPSLVQTPLADLAQVVPDVRANPGATAQSLFFPDENQSVQIQKTGPIVVYTSSCGQPIVHRVVARLTADDGDYVLTKGDSVHNPTVDTDCPRASIDALVQTCNTRLQPCITFFPLAEKDLSGQSVFSVPFVGCVKLWLMDDLVSMVSQGRLPSNFAGIC